MKLRRAQAVVRLRGLQAGEWFAAYGKVRAVAAARNPSSGESGLQRLAQLPSGWKTSRSLTRMPRRSSVQ